MYRFFVVISNMDTSDSYSKVVDVDCTPLDGECMNQEPEELFAWKQAITIAYNNLKNNECINSIELFAC